MTKYRFIAILDSIENKEKTLSTIDATPEYLHIHIVESDKCQTIEEFEKILSDHPDSNLYQWGIPLEKDAKTRSVRVNNKQIKVFGNIGIGSAARGNSEQKDDFTGGGESFMFNQNNYRVTKGNHRFETNDSQGHWTFQVANFNKSNVVKIIGFSEEISGRKDLLAMLKNHSNNKPFVATFDAEFTSGLLARSNGIFAEDKERVQDPNKSVFNQNVVGGHLIGGSDNAGDIKSLEEFFTGQSNCETQIIEQDFAIKLASDILLQPIAELKIAKPDGEFRKPRTAIEVTESVKKIKDFYKIIIKSRDRII